MRRTITGFHRDAEDHWVAELSCGHGQHTRHDPPLSERSWVLTEEGRAERVGTALDCARCDRRELPDGYVEYRRTADFTERTAPSALRSRHTTKAGIWARIHVTQGRLLYRIHDPYHEEHELAAGASGTVLPEVEHEVEPLGSVVFHVAFHRRPGPSWG